MRVVVTGAAGFIGANLVHHLNRFGVTDIVAVDDLTNGAKFANLLGAQLSDYLDHREFYDRIARGELGRFDVIFHEGACSDTMEHDGCFMMRTNYRCSKDLLDICARWGTRLIYASSAAVYGGSNEFTEAPRNERPLNVYGYSKLLFDDIVRRHLPTAGAQVAGLRYFNVYGPREQHKGRMASVAYHQFNQYRSQQTVQLFDGYGGYGPGQQRRDFVSVDDVAAVNLWFLEHPQCSGVFNLGTGRSQPFNDVALAVINACREGDGQSALTLDEAIDREILRYMPFPEALQGKYQCHTQADLDALRRAGCDVDFADVAQGVRRYVRWLSNLPG